MSRTAVGAVVALWVLGLAVGTAAHLGDLVAHGVFAHRAFAPAWLDVYWSSLTVLDPLAAVLLMRRRPQGVDLTCAIMLTDLAANTYAVYGLRHDGLAGAPGLQRLLAFGLLVFLTASWVRRAFSPVAAPVE